MKNEDELRRRAVGLGKRIDLIWLPPRDSNPDTLLQRQVSYR
jgi:hypothetical protein